MFERMFIIMVSNTRWNHLLLYGKFIKIRKMHKRNGFDGHVVLLYLTREIKKWLAEIPLQAFD